MPGQGETRIPRKVKCVWRSHPPQGHHCTKQCAYERAGGSVSPMGLEEASGLMVNGLPDNTLIHRSRPFCTPSAGEPGTPHTLVPIISPNKDTHMRRTQVYWTQPDPMHPRIPNAHELLSFISAARPDGVSVSTRGRSESRYAVHDRDDFLLHPAGQMSIATFFDISPGRTQVQRHRRPRPDHGEFTCTL